MNWQRFFTSRVVSHGGSAVARRTRNLKVSGSIPRSREKAGTTETLIFHVLTFTVVSVVRNPLETVGPVVGAVASSKLSIGFANKTHSLYKHVHDMAYRRLS